MKSRVLLTGNLDFMGLAELLQLLGSNGSTGILRIKSKYVQSPGLIYFVDGNPVDASSGSLTGLDALYSLFGWVTGEFEFSMEHVTRKNVIKKSRMEIILEALRMLDDHQIEKVGPVSVQETSLVETDKGTTIPFIKGPLVDYLFVVDEEEFSDGQTITQEGKHGTWMWVILDGAVEIIRETPKGPVSILRLGVGAFIASFTAFLVKGHIRSASVVAVGKVQLGVVDTQRLYTEYGQMSDESRGYVLSLDKRLREVSDRVVEFFSGQNSLEAFVKDRKQIIKQGDSDERMLRITQGEASIIRNTKHGYVPLANLSEGDFVGHVPFLDIGHEPYSASVFGSKDLEVSVLETDNLQKEYHQLSVTLGNFVENLATCISVTTKIACDFHKKLGNKKSDNS
jgi:CRP-like cAMP-binding protein